MSGRIEQAARVLFEGAAYGTWDDAEDWRRGKYRPSSTLWKVNTTPTHRPPTHDQLGA